MHLWQCNCAVTHHNHIYNREAYQCTVKAMCSHQRSQLVDLPLQRHQLSGLVFTHPLQVLSLGVVLQHIKKTSAIVTYLLKV